MKQIIFKSLQSKKLPAILIIAFFTLFAGVKTNAQTDWGIEAGINASTLSNIGNIYDNTDVNTGFDLGIFAVHNFSNWVGIKSGISYMAKGKKTELSELNLDLPAAGDVEVKGTLHYAVIPLEAELSAKMKGNKHVFFASGPYLGYLLESDYELEGEKVEIDGFTDDFDYGWTFELGAEFPALKNSAIRASFSYDMGLKKVVNIENSNWRNKTASFKLGFLF